MLYPNIIKPLFDTIVSVLGFLLLLPLFLFAVILLAISNRGAVFFIQKRPGKNGRNFRLIKFKTMNERKDGEGNLLPDAERITKLGAFIRQSSIDEIPQLLNVIIGDMSLVGPRPLLVDYLPLYTARQARRHEVKPGITGWAQVNGRNAISWEQKFEYDVWYVENFNFSVDIKILFQTVGKVFKREGISSQTSATMEKFGGSDGV